MWSSQVEYWNRSTGIVHEFPYNLLLNIRQLNSLAFSFSGPSDSLQFSIFFYYSSSFAISNSFFFIIEFFFSLILFHFLRLALSLGYIPVFLPSKQNLQCWAEFMDSLGFTIRFICHSLLFNNTLSFVSSFFVHPMMLTSIQVWR